MIKIQDLPTTPPSELNKNEIEAITKNYIDRLGALQEVLFAEKKHGLLIIFQGMDASGKDGAVRKVFEECHPNGLQSFSFKKPSEEELAHDFLWRVHKLAPPRGMIHIFNRSHYEEVLIQRVHGWVGPKEIERRFEFINLFENLLQEEAGTHIFKFFLNISFEQQEIELRQRLEEKDKHWKHNDNDWKERQYWDEYMEAYEAVLNKSTIPWFNIPVDERWYRDYIISKTLVEALEKLNMQYPPLPEETSMR